MARHQESGHVEQVNEDLVPAEKEENEKDTEDERNLSDRVERRYW